MQLGLAWDCFGVQVIFFQIQSSAALRAMTGTEGDGAEMLLATFFKLLKLCGTINNWIFPVSILPSTDSVIPNSMAIELCFLCGASNIRSPNACLIAPLLYGSIIYSTIL